MNDETLYKIRWAFDQYQLFAKSTAVYPKKNYISGLTYTVLGLVGETGEIVEKVKKAIRDSEGIINEDTRSAIRSEIGDVLWYLSQLSQELGFSFGDVAALNVMKLESRQERGVLRGQGDTR